MRNAASLAAEFERVFTQEQSAVLARTITAAYEDLIKTSDFNELKEIVRDLAQAQTRTESRIDGLAQSMEELAQAQTRTESAVQELARQMQDTRREVGGIAMTLGYALENEAYRSLPAFLKRHYDIEVSSPLIRTEVNGREVNFLAEGTRDGKSIVVVGEAKSRLDSVETLRQIDSQVEAARVAYPNKEIQPLLVTHYARPQLLERARTEGVIVVQSFEW